MMYESPALAPGFLVASPSLGDSNFDQSVVLLASHSSVGSMGFVINRKSHLQLHELLQELEIPVHVTNQHVLLGGPVQGHVGYVMYEHHEHAPLAPGIGISTTISLSPSRDILIAGAAGKLPGRFELILGHAGWDSDQLYRELNAGQWLHAELAPEMLFDAPLGDRWTTAYDCMGIDPWGVINVKGGARA
jgi:putative transcriptional regulator